MNRIISATIAVVLSFFLFTGATSTTTFTISNTVNENLGNVTLAASEGSVVVNVPGTGTFSAQASNVMAVTINNQTVARPSTQAISLPTGRKIKITWNTNFITIIDELEV